MGHYFNSSGRDGSLLPRRHRPRRLPRPCRVREEARAPLAPPALTPRYRDDNDRRIRRRASSAAGSAPPCWREKLSELKPGLAITVVEAGQKIFDFENRASYRQRSLDYGENAWPADFIDDQAGAGVISRTMAVGGSALHWGGVTNGSPRRTSP